MHVKSRGLATDLMLAGFDGEVVHGTSHGTSYVAVRTPSNPAFWWGNFVLFAAPPPDGQIARWQAIFDREVGCVAGIEHHNFSWDAVRGEQGNAEAFVARGYTLARAIFLAARSVRRSPHHREEVVVRPIRGDAEWAGALEIQHQSLAPAQDTASFRAFQSTQMHRSRAMVESGFMSWFGAFIEGRLVATMGLCVQKGVGRCQAVATLPAYRRNGTASTLVHDVCAYGFERMGAAEIWIMTGEDNAAARVYRSVGFEDTERVSSLSISTRTGPAHGA